MTFRLAAWNSRAGSLPTSAIVWPSFGVPNESHVCLSTSSLSISCDRPSRSATAPMMAANSSSRCGPGPLLPARPRSPHSQRTSAAFARMASSWPRTLVLSSFSACWRTSSAISARSSSRVKVSAALPSSSGIPSAVPAWANCSCRFTARANSSPSSGSTCSSISRQETAQMIRCPPRPPARCPSVTWMSRLSPLATPRSCSWNSGKSPLPLAPSSNFMPSAEPTSNGDPREPPGVNSKP
mmetsp:Transcript_74643/g.205802  ORF Transcript_74643/g.205802 Transcript_74643/m.205802 type:complete len:240 (-) Transcript_74643:673-1392(-)